MWISWSSKTCTGLHRLVCNTQLISFLTASWGDCDQQQPYHSCTLGRKWGIKELQSDRWLTSTDQEAGNVLKAQCQFVNHIKSWVLCVSSPPPLYSSLTCRLQRVTALAVEEGTSKKTLRCAAFIVKPVFCHCLPSFLSSISLLFPSLWRKMDLPACACALHHCQVPHGGPPPFSQTGHQPLAGIIPHLQKLSPLLLNKCGCSKRVVLLIHLTARHVQCLLRET